MIRVGDKLPEIGFKIMGQNGPENLSAQDLFAGKKVVLFSVPGAFTPTCSAQHLPSFLANFEALKAKAVDTTACVAVNDVFVMDAWGKSQSVGYRVTMLADGAGKWARAVGLELDLTAADMGVRGQRFAMIVEDGILKDLAVEEGGGFDVSSAESVLKRL